jgi:NAD(P)H-flavin reductase
MHTGKGQIVELILENGLRHARISCPVNLLPSPGQYLLADTASPPGLLPVSLFSTESTLEGFIACAPIPETWTPGTKITLRGPLGHGFTLPLSARKLVLVALDVSPSRLLGLMRIALNQGAAVALVSQSGEFRLPDEVEVQPLSALGEIVQWADYVAFDVARENLLELKQMMEEQNQMLVKSEAQVLIRTQMPCGGVAECAVCVVTLKSGWKMPCKDGPVFNWADI